MNLTFYQKTILEELLNKYENSKHYMDGTPYNRAIAVKPTDIYADYDSDYADIDEEKDFLRDLLDLMRKNYISIDEEHGRVKRIRLILESADAIYNVLDRLPRKISTEKQINFYKKWLNKNQIIDRYCQDQISLLELGKNAKYEIGDAENLLKLLDYICNNKETILERELSIVIFGNTKRFKDEYRLKLISLLKNYGNFDEIIKSLDNEKEVERAILEEFFIYANPEYVYFKGAATLTFSDGTTFNVSQNIPLALQIEKIALIESFIIKDTNIVTIENLASYNRICTENTFFIYLAGYHSLAKQQLIRFIYSHNPEKKWYHFGDIDPDGFLILENLKNKSGIDFEPIYMGTGELAQYARYSKPLEKNDIIKARNLLNKGLYMEEMRFMLDNNIKLEQEVISWMNKSNGVRQ